MCDIPKKVKCDQQLINLSSLKQLLRPEGFIVGEEDTELVPTTNLRPASAHPEAAGSEQGPEEPRAGAAVGMFPSKPFCDTSGGGKAVTELSEMCPSDGFTADQAPILLG